MTRYFTLEQMKDCWDACYNHLLEDANCGSLPNIHPSREEYLASVEPGEGEKELQQYAQQLRIKNSYLEERINHLLVKINNYEQGFKRN